MKWFGKIAESSIQNLMFEKPAKTMVSISVGWLYIIDSSS